MARSKVDEAKQCQRCGGKAETGAILLDKVPNRRGAVGAWFFPMCHPCRAAWLKTSALPWLEIPVFFSFARSADKVA